MMIKLFLLLLTYSVNPLTQDNSKYIISKTGLGTIEIGTATVEEVQKIFPGGELTTITNGGKVLNYVAKMENGESKVIPLKKPQQQQVTYVLEKEGVQFDFNYSGKLMSIVIWGKGKFKTDRGIELGKSTFKDLTEQYGKKGWSTVHQKFVKFHDNLFFYAEQAAHLKPPKEGSKIDRIVVLIP